MGGWLSALTRRGQSVVCALGKLVRERVRTRRQLEAAAALISANSNPYSGPGKAQAQCIVFSMDRALQLHGLLGSYFENVTDPAPISVLYRCSDESHRQAYREVFEEYDGRLERTVEEVWPGDFRRQLLTLLRAVNSEKCFFLVDDDLFIEEVSLAEMLALDSRYVIPSLRMGVNLTDSYTLNEKQQLPAMFRGVGLAQDERELDAAIYADKKNEILFWQWGAGTLDWGYPLSVDGHIFDTAEIRTLAEMTEFSSPNTFEAALQAHSWLFEARRGACYRKSRLVNIPCNRVQEDFTNRHGSVHQDELLERWQRGLRMDYRALYRVVNRSAHEELPIGFVSRRS